MRNIFILIISHVLGQNNILILNAASVSYNIDPANNETYRSDWGLREIGFNFWKSF